LLKQDTANKPPMVPLPPSILKALVGNLLGVGVLFFNDKNDNGKPRTNTNAKFSMTLKSSEYTKHLWYNIYNSIMTTTPPLILYSIKSSRVILHYQFNSRMLPELTQLHSLWYVWSNDLRKFIKIVPHNIYQLLTPIGLAHWIMDSGFRFGDGIILKTECFTYFEVQLLVSVLNRKFGLDTEVLPVGYCDNDGKLIMKGHRIYISDKPGNKFKLDSLVIPYFIPSMLYKLNYK